MLRPFDDLLFMTGATFIGVLTSTKLRGFVRVSYVLLAVTWGYLASLGADIHTGPYAALAFVGSFPVGLLMVLILWKSGAL